MLLFPLFVKLAGRPCVVVGAGPVGESKIASLLAADAIVRVVSLLHRLSPSPESTTLTRFRDAFVARYEGRSVPLAASRVSRGRTKA